MVVAPARPETKFKFVIQCSGTRKDGKICNEVLCRTTLAEWERKVLAGLIEFKCDRCGTKAEFR